MGTLQMATNGADTHAMPSTVLCCHLEDLVPLSPRAKPSNSVTVQVPGASSGSMRRVGAPCLRAHSAFSLSTALGSDWIVLQSIRYKPAKSFAAWA